MNKYIAMGWIRHTEEDIYNDGCQPQTSATSGGHDTFNAPTLDALIKQCAAFEGQQDLKNCLLDSCEEAGRLDVQVYEDAEGVAADERDFERWKEGKQKLWLVTYTFNLLKAEKVVLSRNVEDPSLYASE